MSSVLLCTLVALLPSQIRYDTLSRTPVGPDVVHMKMVVTSIPWRIEVLEVDLTNPWITFETVKSNDRLGGGLERTSSMAARRDRPSHYVVGAVNADFFSFETSNPNSMQVAGGEILLRERTDYPGVAFAPDNRIAFGKPVFSGSVVARGVSRVINGVNEARDLNELILFNSTGGLTTGTDATGIEARITPLDGWRMNDSLRCLVDTVVNGVGSMVHRAGSAVLSGQGIAATWLTSNVVAGDTLVLVQRAFSGFPPYRELIGGHPLLVQNGVKNTLSSADGLVTTRNPRTLIGVNADTTKLYLVVVDGRQSGYSAGMTLWECQDFMHDVLGTFHALNFDGGGSSTMVVRGAVVNSPSDPGGERSVANSLQVISLAAPGPLASLNILETHADVFQGGAFRFHATGADAFHNPIDLPVSAVWSCDSVIGTVDSTGLFSAHETNATGWVYLRSGDVADSAVVVVRMLTSLRVYPSTLVLVPGERLTLSVRGEDSQGNRAVLQNAQASYVTSGGVVHADAAGVVTATGFGAGQVLVQLDTLENVIPVNTWGRDTTVVVEPFDDRFLWDWEVVNADADNFTFGILQDTNVVPTPAFRFTYDVVAPNGQVRLQTDLPISGRVDSLYLRVLGDGGGHVFRLYLKDKDGEVFYIQAPGTVNWNGTWKTVNFRTALAMPVTGGTIDYPVTITQVMVTIGQLNASGGHSIGHVTMDDLTAHYPSRAVSAQVLFDFNTAVKVSGWLQPWGVGSGQTAGITTASNLAWSQDHPYEGDGVGKWTLYDDPALTTDWSIRIARSGPTTELGSMLKGSYIGAWIWGEGESNLTIRTVIRDGDSKIEQGPPFRIAHVGWKLIGGKLDDALYDGWLTGDGNLTDQANKFNGFRVMGSNAALDGQSRILYIDKMVTSALTVPTGFIAFNVNRNGPNVQVYWSVNSEISVSRYVVERGNGGTFSEIGSVDAVGNTDTTKHYEFVDVPAAAVYQYRVRQITNDGGQETTAPITIDVSTGVSSPEGVPHVFALHHNYPNPFNPTTTISFTLERTARATLVVYDLLGREVARLADDVLSAGVEHRATLDGATLPSGMYLVRLTSGARAFVRRIVLLK